jgi:hypothetical protein
MTYQDISKIAIDTPTWVWGVLAYLLVVGIKAMRDRIVYLPKLFIMPIILMGLKYKALISVIYMGFMLIGVFIGVIIGRRTDVKICKDLKSIELPGSYFTLILLLLFFSIKYVFGYLEATQFEIVEQYGFIEISISGILSGYFLGRSIFYVYRYYQEKVS